MRRDPFTLRVSWSVMAWYVMCVGPALRIWPNHLKRVFLNLRTRLREVVDARASCWIVLEVNEASIRLFTPLRRRIVLSVNFHVSHPNERSEHTEAEYSLILILMGGKVR